MTSRMQRAIELRDAALNLVRAHGRWESAKNISGKYLFAEIDGLRILHTTPFTRLPEPPEAIKYMAALSGRPMNLPYSLDVWAPGSGKVFFIKWDGKAQFNLVNFRRGGWEDVLLSLAQERSAA
jgi:hypothetical protein